MTASISQFALEVERAFDLPPGILTRGRDAVIHCGGNLRRTHTTVQEAIHRLGAPVIISCEFTPLTVLELLEDAGIPRSRIWFDYRPWDTVLHVVTDRFHLRRATWLARIILAGTGIRVVGHAHDDPWQAGRKDPLVRLVKDVLRALWVRATGHLVFDRDIKLARIEEMILSREAVRSVDPTLLLPNLKPRSS
jgi:hypothetical protein